MNEHMQADTPVFVRAFTHTHTRAHAYNTSADMDTHTHTQGEKVTASVILQMVS